MIIFKSTNFQIQAGIFKERTLSSFQGLAIRGNGSFNIVKNSSLKTNNLNLSNITILQSMKEFQGATFQIDSQFNCLHFISPSQSAVNGISCYSYDKLRGTQASLSTCASLLYRNYYVHSAGQLGEEINLLSNTPIRVQHGYAFIDEAESKDFENTEFNWGDLDNYQVGVHQNCQVILKSIKNGYLFLDQPQFVHHVFASAFSFQDNVVSNNFTFQLSQFLLSAEYKATILAAWENSVLFPGYDGSNVCFLTLLGSGTFCNPKQIIFDAILSAEKEIVESGLTVYLIVEDDIDFSHACGKLRGMVERTQGRIITDPSQLLS